MFENYNPKFTLFPRNICVFKEPSGDSDDKKWFTIDGNSDIGAEWWVKF